MLRAIVLGGTAALFTLLLVCAIGGQVPLLPSVVMMGVLLVVLLLERTHYKPLAETPPAGDWQETGERFIDPESGREVAVYFQPATGERRYVAVDG